MAKETFKELTPAQAPNLKIEEQQENTRGRFALIFISGYLGLVILLIMLTTFFGLAGESVKDFLLAIGSPLGFIVGYYFKSADSK